MLWAADLEPVRMFHRQYHDHKCQVCEEGITDLQAAQLDKGIQTFSFGSH